MIFHKLFFLLMVTFFKGDFSPAHIEVLCFRVCDKFGAHGFGYSEVCFISSALWYSHMVELITGSRRNIHARHFNSELL